MTETTLVMPPQHITCLSLGVSSQPLSFASSTTRVFLKTVTRQGARELKWKEPAVRHHSQPWSGTCSVIEEQVNRPWKETSGCRMKMTNLSCEKHFNSVAPSGRWCVFHCECIISVVDNVEIYVLFLIADHTSITLNSHTDITWER